ncbi:hypothetical protein PIB30_010349 [Stylosanthes scabra]|uniref:Uncharacterized protein n=1 Tax=Stylosanthes scabra TaxID=79078 RepID=A0ABU6V7Q9_9FABA|nr:hypothetical protein [Stylosanthes scabra]
MYGLRCRYHRGAEKTAADSQCHGSLQTPPSIPKPYRVLCTVPTFPHGGCRTSLVSVPSICSKPRLYWLWLRRLPISNPNLPRCCYSGSGEASAGTDIKELIALEMSKQVNQLFIAIQFSEIFRYSLGRSDC